MIVLTCNLFRRNLITIIDETNIRIGYLASLNGFRLPHDLLIGRLGGDGIDIPG